MSKKIKFKEAFNRLEEIARSMENDDISLEESLELYEEGMKLIDLCNQKLETAEKKIQILSKASEGAFQTRPLDTLDDSE